MKIYSVGGSIRDRLLGRPVKDRDFVVIGAGEASFFQAFPRARKQGKGVPVYRVGHDEYILSQADNIENDLLARDFTINALAEDAEGQLYAHPLALDDLRNRVLRPAGPQSFRDDPLRVFRAARFLAVLPEFSPAPELLPAMKQIAPLLEKPAPERVGRELCMALGGEAPSRFFTVLADADCLDPWFREMKSSLSVPAGPVPYHRGSLFEHLLEVVEGLRGQPFRAWMGLCHDLGKLGTAREKWPSHHGHDVAGIAMAREFGERLRLPGRFVEAGGLAAKYHMVAGRYDSLRPGTRVDLLLALHRENLLEDLFALVRADHGEDFFDMAAGDLHTLLAVHLPENHGLSGIRAGQRLRDLRCQALKTRSVSPA